MSNRKRLRPLARHDGHTTTVAACCECACGPRIAALADALARVLVEVRDALADEPAPYAPVHPMPTRIVPEPRVLPGETVGEFWNRTGRAAGPSRLTEEDR